MRTKQHQFLLDLFGECDPEMYVCIWRRDTKETRRFKVKDLSNAADYARDVGETADVYVGCGLQPDDGPPDKRGKANTVCCIVGTWADIDVGSHGNTRKYLPTIAAATNFLAELPVKATKVVSTGGGVHAWWLFHEPFVITTEEERTEAQQVVGRWQLLLRRRLGKYDLDSTFDLSRVLRIPGTTNHKNTEDKASVVELVNDGPRCDTSDLLEYAPEGMVAITDSMESESGKTINITINPLAEPPGHKLSALTDDDRFKKTWDRQREDLKDQTGSAYCLSLANYAALASWSDQEICDMLVAWRRKHEPNNQKLDRPEWFIDRIQTARKATGVIGSRQVAAEALADARENPVAPEAELLRFVSDVVGFRLLGVMKRVIFDATGFIETPSFVLDIQVGGKEPQKVILDNVDYILDQRRFAKISGGHAGRVLPRMKSKEWDNVSQAILSVCQEVPDVPEAGSLENVRNVLRRYLAEAPVTRDAGDAVGTDNVLKPDDGSPMQFSWSAFSAWASNNRIIKLSNAELSRAIVEIGCKRISYDRKGKNGRVKATFWTVPEEL